MPTIAQQTKTETTQSEKEARALREKQPQLKQATKTENQTISTNSTAVKTVEEPATTKNGASLKKAEKSPISTAKTSSNTTHTLPPERKAQLDEKSTNTTTPTGLDYSKMSNHQLKGEDYQVAKQARLQQKLPEKNSSVKAIKQIKQSDFNKLPADRQQQIKSNPSQYQIVEG